MDFLYLIEQKTNTFIMDNLDNYSKSIDMHNSIQRFLIDIASEFNFIGEKEFKVMNYRKDRNGYIDVLWNGHNNAIAFEIDSCAKKNSMFKLAKISATNRIWICCRHEECKRLLYEYGLFDLISIIPVFNYRSYYRRVLRLIAWLKTEDKAKATQFISR